MQKNWKSIIGSICFCGVLTSVPLTAYADMTPVQQSIRTELTGVNYIENINQGNSSENPIMVAKLEMEEEDADEGEIEEEDIMLANQQAEDFALASAQMQAVVQEEVARAESAQLKTDLRQQIVNYALSFVGGPYRYGGNDPRTGVDCSGFVRYIMSNAAGVQLARSSGSQAGQGVAVSAEQMQPGDLIFYSKGGRINHVAMYIGSGKVVHASTYATGIKISDWNYRTPAKIVNVLG